MGPTLLRILRELGVKLDTRVKREMSDESCRIMDYGGSMEFGTNRVANVRFIASGV